MARDIYQLAIHYNVGPQRALNVLHFAEDTENTPNPDVMAHACIAGFVTDLQPNWLACLTESTAIIGYKARRINNGGGPGIAVAAPTLQGTRTGHMSAGAVGPCLVWSYKQLDDDWKAGRTFLPGVSEADIDDNVFSDDLIEAIQDLFELMLAVPATHTTSPVANFEFGIYSGKFNTFSGCEAATLSGKPGIQNNRLKPSF